MRMRDRIATVATEDADFYVILTPEVAAKVAEMPLLEMNETIRNECEPASVTNSESPDLYIGCEDDGDDLNDLRQCLRELGKMASNPEPVRQADMFNQIVTLDSGRKVEFWVNKKTGDVSVEVSEDVNKRGTTAASLNVNNIRLHDLA